MTGRTILILSGGVGGLTLASGIALPKAGVFADRREHVVAAVSRKQSKSRK